MSVVLPRVPINEMNSTLERKQQMDKRAIAEVSIHPLLAQRWSPRSFDENATLPDHDLFAILEAARWAPSANNVQPWRFFVGRRGDETIAVTGETPERKRIRSGSLDAGLANSSMSIQAQALGLRTHPMAGFHRDAGARRDRSGWLTLLKLSGQRVNAFQ